MQATAQSSSRPSPAAQPAPSRVSLQRRSRRRWRSGWASAARQPWTAGWQTPCDMSAAASGTWPATGRSSVITTWYANPNVEPSPNQISTWNAGPRCQPCCLATGTIRDASARVTSGASKHMPQLLGLRPGIPSWLEAPPLHGGIPSRLPPGRAQRS